MVPVLFWEKIPVVIDETKMCCKAFLDFGNSVFFSKKLVILSFWALTPAGATVLPRNQFRYIRLNDTYKQDWHAFLQAFQKQFSFQKNAYYAEVEALNLSKKDNETVRHFALKVQQLVEKGWCNENASTINLKCNESFTKGLPKNLKDFAIKRQVKHTSTVLEPSIPFHTLVKLVDAEDIANDKIRTHDLALEVSNITKQLHTQTLERSSQEQLMFTQPKDPNNKSEPAYKKYCSYCHRTNHPNSACFKKQRDDGDRRDAYAQSKSPQKSIVQYFRSPSNDRTKHYDNRYRSRST